MYFVSLRLNLEDRILIHSQQDQATICDDKNVQNKLCSEDQIGSFILAPNASNVSESAILSQAIHLNDPPAITYPVKKTGFYCVSTYAFSGQPYKGVVEFRNAYGELPAAQIAKLPFYGGLTIVYAAIGAYVPSLQKRGFSTHLGF